MSSAAMASSSVSQEELEHDFEKTSRRSRIRMARGRDVRGQQTAATACRIAAETLAEADDGGETRAPDASGYSGDHDASPKPAARAKDKRPIRPPHIVKGKQQQRDRRKLREKRRSTGVVHMPSTEVSSTGGSTNEDDEDLSTGREAAAVTAAETRRNLHHNEQTDAAPPTVPEQFQNTLRNKSETKIKLVEVVQERRALWDPRCKEYKLKPALKEQQWNQVGLQLGITGEEAKAKFKNIRDAYAKTRKKVAEIPSGSQVEKMTRLQLQQARLLSFLDPVLAPKLTCSNYNSAPKTADVSIANTSIIIESDSIQAGVYNGLEPADDTASADIPDDSSSSGAPSDRSPSHNDPPLLSNASMFTPPGPSNVPAQTPRKGGKRRRNEQAISDLQKTLDQLTESKSEHDGFFRVLKPLLGKRGAQKAELFKHQVYGDAIKLVYGENSLSDLS